MNPGSGYYFTGILAMLARLWRALCLGGLAVGSAVLLVADEVNDWFSALRGLSAPPEKGDCTPQTL